MITNNKSIKIALLLVYISIVFYIVFFSFGYGRISGEILRYNDMNLTPFETIKRYYNSARTVGWDSVSLNILGNIAIFIPLVPLISINIKRKISFLNYLLLCVIVSFFIELCQMIFHVGVFDIDDIILNIIGGILGLLLINNSTFLGKKGGK